MGLGLCRLTKYLDGFCTFPCSMVSGLRVVGRGGFVSWTAQ